MKKTSTKLYIVATIFFVFNILANSMNLNPIYPATAFFYAFMITVYAAIWIITSAGKIVLERTEQGMLNVDFKKSKPLPKKAIYLVIGVWILYFGVSIYSSVLFHPATYRDQMPDYRTGDFSSEIQAIDIEQVPIVDMALARNLADKKLGERPSLGSQVNLGTPTIQTVNGELVWVVPLYHSGFFQWVTNMEGTPGYIVVSATNTNDVEYVEGYNIKYQPSAFFFDNLYFHTRFTQALFTGTTDYSFELDDDGNPHWVITTYKNIVGFALPEATGVIVIDAQTGEGEEYSLDEIPDWVDRVQPENFILQQINNKGEYVRGVFNFSDKDKYKTSEGNIIVYNNDRCYLFTGITSVGADESAIGFVMVDMVTKEPVLYQMAGATEYAAQGSAEGKVQQYGYYASFPLILNVEGVPTYFMTLKDADGLIKQFAYVSVRDYLIVGVGETSQDARENYLDALNDSGIDTSIPVDEETVKTATFTIDRIGQQYAGEESIYRFTSNEYPQLIFDAQSSLSAALSLTLVGDSVTIEYIQHTEDDVLVQVTEFVNNSLGKDVESIELEEEAQEEVLQEDQGEVVDEE